jgi:Rieske Fe-S protein
MTKSLWKAKSPNPDFPSLKEDIEVDIAIIGGHHKVGQTDNHEAYFSKLEKEARSRFDIASIEYKWSAQHYKPADGLPYIGESAEEGIYMATGFSTDGLTYGTLAAMILSDIIAGKENPWAKTYDAKRFTPIASAKTFIKENMNVLGEYLKDYPGNTDVELFSQIKPGEGKIVEKKNEKWAVHRSENGELHAISAVCTHMECIVNWNNAEKTWDCPCHGSRFKTTGEVIEGPAFMPLEKKKTN